MNRPPTLLYLVGFLTIAVAGLYWFGFFDTRPKSKSIVESLKDPQVITSRDGTSFILADGRRAILPDVNTLAFKERTPFLNAACVQGVEVNNGRMIGLIEIHHWCGNDPVRNHIARVDLSDLALYTGEGKGTIIAHADRPEKCLTDSGWNISDYVLFLAWQQYAKHQPE